MSKQRPSSKINHTKEPKIIHLKSVSSTNDYAQLLARKGVPHGTTVRADIQTHGKGRGGRKWLSPVGGLWMSVVLRPLLNVRLDLLPAFCSLAVAKVLERKGIKARLKWPNDVTINGKKIAGVLCEAEIEGAAPQWIIVGIGLNVNNQPPNLENELVQQTATSIIKVRNRRSSLTSLAREIRKQILLTFDQLTAGKERYLLDDYNAILETRGRKLRATLERRVLTGIGGEMDHEGRLLINVRKGVSHVVTAQDVSYLELL